MTLKGWRVVKPQHNQSITQMLDMTICRASFTIRVLGLVKVNVAIFRKNFVIALAPIFINGFQYNFTQILGMTISRAKKVREKSRECHNYKPQPFPDLRGRGNRQIQRSTNRTNVRKALRLTLSSPSEVIAILKGLKNARTKWQMERHTTNRLVE